MVITPDPVPCSLIRLTWPLSASTSTSLTRRLAVLAVSATASVTSSQAGRRSPQCQPHPRVEQQWGHWGQKIRKIFRRLRRSDDGSFPRFTCTCFSALPLLLPVVRSILPAARNLLYHRNSFFVQQILQIPTRPLGSSACQLIIKSHLRRTNCTSIMVLNYLCRLGKTKQSCQCVDLFACLSVSVPNFLWPYARRLATMQGSLSRYINPSLPVSNKAGKLAGPLPHPKAETLFCICFSLLPFSLQACLPACLPPRWLGMSLTRGPAADPRSLSFSLTLAQCYGRGPRLHWPVVFTLTSP